MALSAPTTRLEVEDPGGLAIQVADGATMYQGGFVGIRTPGNATSQGDAQPYNDAANVMFGGIAESVDGLASAAGDGTSGVKAAVSILPRLLKRAAVTGVTAASDVMAYVYATDDDVLSLTRPTTGGPVGVVTKFHATAVADVLTFGLLGQLLSDVAGTREVVHLGHFDWTDIADGNLRTGLTFPMHATIVDLYAVWDVASTGAGGTAAINLEIGGADVTGGVLTMITGASKGDRLDDTAITGANRFHEGDLIDVEASGTAGTRTTGTFDLYMVVERQPGS